jgi:hypothetical protein
LRRNDYEGKIEDPQGYHFPFSVLAYRGTTRWLPGVLTDFEVQYLHYEVTQEQSLNWTK